MKKYIWVSVLCCLMIGYYTYALMVLSSEIKAQTEWLQSFSQQESDIAESLMAIWDANEVIQGNTIRISIFLSINIFLTVLILIRSLQTNPVKIN